MQGLSDLVTVCRSALQICHWLLAGKAATGVEGEPGDLPDRGYWDYHPNHEALIVYCPAARGGLHAKGLVYECAKLFYSADRAEASREAPIRVSSLRNRSFAVSALSSVFAGFR